MGRRNAGLGHEVYDCGGAVRRNVEVRLNRDGSLDEVVGERCMIHLEQMSATHWWMEVGLPDGTRCHVNFHSKATIRANYADEGEQPFAVVRA